ncbi:MAG: hypothetical protein J1F09_04230 [Oscillospiraceae bacterium]|nr:hypothetical protein [Oscillospiraceae bacterium]
MLEKNYTNPEDRGRFGFSESGEFRAPYKSEHVIVSVLIAGMVVMAVLAFLLTVTVVRTGIGVGSDADSVKLFVGLTGVIILAILESLVILGFVLMIKFVLSGYECKYDATDEKIIISDGGNTRTIYYKDVQTVHFQPRHFFRKVQGYDVTVKVNGALEEFGITSDSFISEKTTPFFIIKERMEMIRQAEYAERQRNEGLVSAVRTDSITTKPKKTVTDRVDSLLNQPDVMPSIGIAKTSLEKPAPETPTETRVSPTAGGYVADMPSVAKPAKTYVGTDNREYSRNDIVSRGEFCVTHTRKTTLLLSIFSAVFMAVALVLLGIYVIASVGFYFNFIGVLIFGGWMYVLGAILLGAAGVVFWRYLVKGTECSYKANGYELIIYQKGKPDEHFIYSDVMGVNYKTRKLLWFDHGYDVGILTRYGITEFRYVFPRTGKTGKTIKTENTPFDIIRVMNERTNAAQNTAGAAAEPAVKSENMNSAASVLERVEALYAGEETMLSVSPRKAPDAETEAFEARISPTVNGYKADSPEPEPEIDENEIIAQGTFFAVHSLEKNVIFIVAAIVAFVIIVGFAIAPATNLISDLIHLNVNSLILNGSIVALLVLISPFVIYTIINYMLKGKEHKYRANGKEFIVSQDKKADICIAYKEVNGVYYKPIKFIRKLRGYKVDITMLYGEITFYYMFPGMGRPQKLEDLPFEIIKQHIKK